MFSSEFTPFWKVKSHCCALFAAHVVTFLSCSCRKLHTKHKVVEVKPDPVRREVLIRPTLLLFFPRQLPMFTCACISVKECNESESNICRLAHSICPVSCHFLQPLKKHTSFTARLFLAQHSPDMYSQSVGWPKCFFSFVQLLFLARLCQTCGCNMAAFYV